MKTRKPERTYLIRGFDFRAENFSEPTGVIEDKNTFFEAVSNTQAEAITEMLLGCCSETMTPRYFIKLIEDNTDDGMDINVGNSALECGLSKNMLHVINLKLELSVIDKYEIKALKSPLRDLLKRWAEKCRVKGLRGWRCSAIKTPKFEYDQPGLTVVHIQVILSNAILYSEDKVSVAPMDYQTAMADLKKLHKELSKVPVFSRLYFDHSTHGKGEVF